VLKTALEVATEENIHLKVEIEAFKLLCKNLLKENRQLKVSHSSYKIIIDSLIKFGGTSRTDQVAQEVNRDA
jgi:hypothetical protein